MYRLAQPLKSNPCEIRRNVKRNDADIISRGHRRRTVDESRATKKKEINRNTFSLVMLLSRRKDFSCVAFCARDPAVVRGLKDRQFFSTFVIAISLEINRGVKFVFIIIIKGIHTFNNLSFA